MTCTATEGLDLRKLVLTKNNRAYTGILDHSQPLSFHEENITPEQMKAFKKKRDEVFGQTAVKMCQVARDMLEQSSRQIEEVEFRAKGDLLLVALEEQLQYRPEAITISDLEPRYRKMSAEDTENFSVKLTIKEKFRVQNVSTSIFSLWEAFFDYKANDFDDNYMHPIFKWAIPNLLAKRELTDSLATQIKIQNILVRLRLHKKKLRIKIAELSKQFDEGETVGKYAGRISQRIDAEWNKILRGITSNVAEVSFITNQIIKIWKKKYFFISFKTRFK